MWRPLPGATPTWLHVARQLDPSTALRSKVRQLAQKLRRSVRHVNRVGVRSPVVLCMRTTAGPCARPGLLLLLAHAGRQLAPDAFALPRRALLVRGLAVDCGGARAAGAPGVEHLRRDGPRVGPPAVLLRGLDDGVGPVAVLSILLERGLNQPRSRLRGLVKEAPARAVRPYARSAPVLSGGAVRTPAELRLALG